jgi:hypothetical protein
MTSWHQAFLARLLFVPMGFCIASCDRDPGGGLKGQTNATMTFYGLAVDQDGSPLAGAQFEYRVEAYPKDWTFETRDRDNDVSTVSATTDARGRFQFTVTGCKLIRRKGDRAGYRHLFEEDVHTRAAQTSFYRLIAWGDLWYKTDADHPAVYVFVKDGVKEVSALPCRGGWDSGGAKKFPATPNQPAWPKKPSLEDVSYKPPTTAPTSQPRRSSPPKA